MPLKLEDFMSGVANLGGVASPSKFALEIGLPKALQNKGINTKNLSLLCDSAQLPGVQIGVDDTYKPYGYGVVQKLPWGIVFTETQLTFLVDNSGFIQKFFTDWLDSIVKFNTTEDIGSSTQAFFVNYRDQYQTTIKFHQYDPRNATIATYTLYNAYPLSVYDINMNWASQNDIIHLQVRFTFSRWTVAYSKIDNSAAEAIQKTRTIIDDVVRGSRLIASIEAEFSEIVDGNYSQPIRSLVDNYKQALTLLGGSDRII